MNRLATTATVATLLSLATLGGCRQANDEPLDLGEARAALEEASISAQASSVMAGSIEITTDFTIGGAVEKAAEEVRTYISSQLPCAKVTLERNTLNVEYGALEGNCVYRGHEYSGSHKITVVANDQGQVIVEHDWNELSNGVVKMSGNATVTWDAQDVSRRVQHELTWTRLEDSRQGVGSGDRVQRSLDEGLEVGFRVSGERGWSGEKGDWELDIDDVRMRWADPAPYAGSYTLTTPADKEVTLSFARLDDNTIAVTLKGPKRQFTFKVRTGGAIENTGSSELEES